MVSIAGERLTTSVLGASDKVRTWRTLESEAETKPHSKKQPKRIVGDTGSTGPWDGEWPSVSGHRINNSSRQTREPQLPLALHEVYDLV